MLFELRECRRTRGGHQEFPTNDNVRTCSKKCYLAMLMDKEATSSSIRTLQQQISPAPTSTED